MFNVKKTAKTIRNARKQKNMTQMDLADAMGVSYQAVSNWERGNSMPDISKIADLCEILGIAIDELIGEKKSAVTLQKVIDHQEADISLAELADVAAIMTPQKMEMIVEERAKKETINIKAIIPLAPFLDDEYLEEIAEKVSVEDLSQVIGIAPFLSDEALAKIVLNYDGPIQNITGLAPFLEEDVLDELVEKYLLQENCNIKSLIGLCPFLDEKTVRKIATFAMKHGDYGTITGLAPFM